MFFYSIYGLKIAANAPVSWFQEIGATSTVDFYIKFAVLDENAAEIGTSCNLDYFIDKGFVQTESESRPHLVVTTNSARDTYHFRFFDGVEALIDNTASRILFRWPPTETLEFELSYLTATIVSFALLLRGTFSFHASAVAIDGKAIIAIGDSGAGKSTTAAAFAKMGYPILSDDLVVIRDDIDRFWVQPSFPMIRLWSSSVVALFGRANALPEIVPNHPNWNKQYLRLDGNPYRFQDRELPLGGIYILNSRHSDDLVQINSVSTQEALLSLVANNYSSSFLTKVDRAQEFEMLGRLLPKVPVRQVMPSNNIDRVFQLCETILRDFDRLRASDVRQIPDFSETSGI